MTIDANWANDLYLMAADLPSTLVWSGQTVVGTASPINRSDDVAADGVFNVADVEWCGRLDDFTDSTPPNVRATVEIGGVKYYINDKTTDAACVTLRCKRV